MLTNEDFHLGLGLPRSGKTLTQIENFVLPELLNDIVVYSNTWINLDLPNCKLYTEFEEVERVRNCIVHMDEICQVLDPRDWANESRGVRAFFQLHGHRHVGLITNTQHISLVPKSALIEVSRFFMCEKIWNTGLINSLFPNFPWIVVEETELTLTEIKAEEKGYTIKNYEDDDDLEFGGGEANNIWFKKDKLMHRELNDIKKELIHWYCPTCKQRQGPLVGKNDSAAFADFDKRKGWKQREDLKLEQIPRCPKHTEQNLEIKESGIYDTYFEFEVIEKEIEFKPFYKTVRQVPYRGKLSDRQAEMKRNLEDSFELE